MSEKREKILADNYELYKQQELTFRFPEFNRSDVWELGCDLIDSCRAFDKPLATEIYIGDVMVFRYFPSGTGTLHEMWLSRKRNTVRALGKSSMLVAAELSINKQSIDDIITCFSVTEDYADCGGGFPLRTTDGDIFGFVGVSGMADNYDHAALIGGLERFFQRHGWIK